MVQIKLLNVLFLGLCLLCPVSNYASPATEASTMEKGFFGESLVDDIYWAAGRKSISDKLNPLLHGPDRIYRLSDGTIEIHEVKAYTSWAGKEAMKTTFSGGKPTFELSREWLDNWVSQTLKNPLSSPSDIKSAQIVQKALQSKKFRLVYDEINLTTKQIRTYLVEWDGSSNIILRQLSGPIKIKYFNRKFSRIIKNLSAVRAANVKKVLQNPKILLKGHPRNKEDFQNLCQKRYGKKVTVQPAVITSDGRLLVSIKQGAKSGLLVFGVEAGIATYSYCRGYINKPEYQEKLFDAAVKGTTVGTCTAVAVFLGATPGGWVVLAVSTGGYLIADTSLRIWHEHKAKQYLTPQDLAAFGIPLDSFLELPPDEIFNLSNDSLLNLPTDSLLDMKPDSLLDI